MKHLLDHHAFIVNTDRKSLFAQIKTMVSQAQEVALKELNQRRNALKELLEREDKIYEEEFANKVKSRMDDDRKQRKEILLQIKEENARNEQEFLKTKRIQQYMNSCYEIREAVRHREMLKVKECQQEQILEKERALRRQQQEEGYWLKVQQKNIEEMDRQQRQEESLKKSLTRHVADTLKVQLVELEEKRDKIRQEKLEEKQQLDVLLEEIRLEEFDRKHRGISPKILKYRQELLDMISEKQIHHQKEQMEHIEIHQEILKAISEMDAKESRDLMEKKKALHKATIDYIKYVKHMRDIERQQLEMYNNRIDDLYRVDNCTKRNIQRERERKARLAEKCFAELRKQIQEQCKRRLREEAEQRECKILENRFVREEKSRQQIIEERQRHRRELDNQIQQLKRIQSEEEAKFNKDLERASNDPEFCSQLAGQYISEGIDYLEPHANWRLLSGPSKPCCPTEIKITDRKTMDRKMPGKIMMTKENMKLQ
ncbi:trichohyalin-like, partial [Musca vetustissima]|uniref:trichohyalin-like n=1 Tax=Musca vetustissima TaxID=27455 RepID=UPI002AB7BF81